MILAGDVGGTKVHLALYGFASGRLRLGREQKFPAAEHRSLDEICLRFLGEGDGHPAEKLDEIVAACFGCPGPVRDGRLKLTNLPWTLDARDLQKALGIGHIFLINDLEANGYGVPEIASKDIFTLHEGDPGAVGHRGLVSAGTGLGEALLIWNGMTGRHVPIPSEGGHCDYAARNPREVRLFSYLHEKFKGKPGSPTGRVSFERVASGIGLADNVYQFLRDSEGMEEPQWLRDRMASEDPNAVIGSCAENGSSPLCYETMQIFTAAYGAEAGNVALKVLAMGGIYLGGGIAPKILKTMQGGTFMDAFLDKGRMAPILESIPVRIILDDTCALLGAAAYAEARASELSGRSERAASVSSL
jgi:glucokinase